MDQHLVIELVRMYQEQMRADAARVRLRSTARRFRPRPGRERTLAERWWRQHSDRADVAGLARRRPATLDDLAERVAHGPGGVELELRQFARYARARGVTPVLVSILADPRQPDVARQRAFGQIHAELERLRLTPSRPNVNEGDAA